MRALLGISSKQYRNKYEQFHGVPSATKLSASPDTATKETVKLCQINRTSSVPQREALPTINTIVVECCRPDGQTLKIHTTNESINGVIKAFYTGLYDATDNAQA